MLGTCRLLLSAHGCWALTPHKAARVHGRPRQLDACSPHPCTPTLPACPPLQALALRDFLQPMLAFDPSRRASAKELLQHPWLDQ